MKRRILQLIGSFETGGSERQGLQLARLLKESGRYDVCLACLDATGGLKEEAARCAFGEVTEYKLSSFYDLTFMRQLLRFARYLRRHRIEIVQTHDFYTNVFGMAGARLARVPVRIAARRETSVGWRTPAQKRVERFAYRLASAIVANSEAVQRQLLNEGVASRAIVIHNGIDLARVTPPANFDMNAALAKFGLPVNSVHKFVTIVANLHDPVKGHDTFLRSARNVLRRDPGARFVIAGEGELSAAMQKRAVELGIAAEVFFIGRCDDIASLLAISEVCVSSSTAEGFSNSIIEYMGAGRAVVATNVGGTAEAVVDGETGYLVSAGEHVNMANRTLELLADPVLTRAMGERGRQRVEQQFSCDAQLASTENLYNQLIEARRGQRNKAAETTADPRIEHRSCPE